MMNLHNRKVSEVQMESIFPTEEFLQDEQRRYEFLKKKIEIHNHNIKFVIDNFNRMKDANRILKEQQILLAKYENEFFKDLFEVGKSKAMGYLTEDRLKDGGRDIKYFIEYALRNNLEFYIPKSNRYLSTALYLFDRKKLEMLLLNNLGIPRTMGLTMNVDKFVEFIAEGNVVRYDINPDGYLLIAMAFSDGRLSLR